MSQPFLSSLRLISIVTVIYSLTTDAFDFIEGRADNSQVECAGFSNPQLTYLTYSNDVCYMKEVTIECGWIIDHQGESQQLKKNSFKTSKISAFKYASGGPITTDNNNTLAQMNNCPNALWLAKIQNGKLAARIAPQQQKSPSDYRKLW